MKKSFIEALESIRLCKDHDSLASERIKEISGAFRSSKQTQESVLDACDFLNNLWTTLTLSKSPDILFLASHRLGEEVLLWIWKAQNRQESSTHPKKKEEIKGKGDHSGELIEKFYGFLVIDIPKAMNQSKLVISCEAAQTFWHILYDLLFENEVGSDKKPAVLSALRAAADSNKMELVSPMLERIFADLRVFYSSTSQQISSFPALSLLETLVPIVVFPGKNEMIVLSGFCKVLGRLRGNLLDIVIIPNLTPEATKVLLHLLRYYTSKNLSQGSNLLMVFCIFSAISMLFDRWTSCLGIFEGVEAKLLEDSLRELQVALITSVLVIREKLGPFQQDENVKEERKNSKKLPKENSKQEKEELSKKDKGKPKKAIKKPKQSFCSFCKEALSDSSDALCYFCHFLSAVSPRDFLEAKRITEEVLLKGSFESLDSETQMKIWVYFGSMATFSKESAEIDKSSWCLRKQGELLEIYKTGPKEKERRNKSVSNEEMESLLNQLLFHLVISCSISKLKGAFNSILAEALQKDAPAMAKLRLLEIIGAYTDQKNGMPHLMRTSFIKKCLKMFLEDRHQKVREKSFKIFRPMVIQKMMKSPSLLKDKLLDSSESIRQLAVAWLLCAFFEGKVPLEFFKAIQIQTEILKTLIVLFQDQRKATASLSKFAAGFILFQTYRNEDFCQTLCGSRSLKKYDLMKKLKAFSNPLNEPSKPQKPSKTSIGLSDRLLLNVFGEDEQWGHLEELILYLKRKIPESFDSLTQELGGITQALLEKQSNTDSVCSILPCVMLFAGESPSLIAKYIAKLVEMLQNALKTQDHSSFLIARSIRKLIQLAQEIHQPLIESKVMQIHKLAEEHFANTKTQVSLELLRLIFLISAEYQTEESTKSIGQIVELLLKIISSTNDITLHSVKTISLLTWALNAFCTFYKYFGRGSSDCQTDLTLLNIRLLKMCQNIEDASKTQPVESVNLLQRAIVRFVFQISILDQRFTECLEKLVSNTSNLDETSLLFISKKVRNVLCPKKTNQMVLEKENKSSAETFCYHFLKEKAQFLFSLAPSSKNPLFRSVISELICFVNLKREMTPVIYLSPLFALAFDDQKATRQNALSAFSLLHKRAPSEIAKELFPAAFLAIFKCKNTKKDPIIHWWIDASPLNTDQAIVPSSPSRIEESSDPRNWTPVCFKNPAGRFSSARRQSLNPSHEAPSFLQEPDTLFFLPFREIVDQCNMGTIQLSKKQLTQKNDVFYQTLKSLCKILKGNKLGELTLLLRAQVQSDMASDEIVEFVLGMIMTGKRKWPPGSVKSLIEAMREHLLQNSHKFSEEEEPLRVGLVLVAAIISFSSLSLKIRQYSVLEKEITDQMQELSQKNEEVELRAQVLRKNFKIMREKLEEGHEAGRCLMKEFMYDGIGKTMVKWSFLQGNRRQNEE